MNLKHDYSLLHVWCYISEAALDSYGLHLTHNVVYLNRFGAQVFKNNRTLVTNLYKLRGSTQKQNILRSDNTKPVLPQKPGEKNVKTAHCERILQSTWAFPCKPGQLPPLCDPAVLQALEFSPLSCYFPLCLSPKRDDPKHLLPLLLLLALNGKGIWILFPGKTILTSYHLTEQQTTPYLQDPGRCGRALP